jgi:hypothetical protein
VAHARRVDRGVDVGERVRVGVPPRPREPVRVAREATLVEPPLGAERARLVGEPERVAVQLLVPEEGLRATPPPFRTTRALPEAPLTTAAPSPSSR